MIRAVRPLSLVVVLLRAPLTTIYEQAMAAAAVQVAVELTIRRPA